MKLCLQSLANQVNARGSLARLNSYLRYGIDSAQCCDVMFNDDILTSSDCIPKKSLSPVKYLQHLCGLDEALVSPGQLSSYFRLSKNTTIGPEISRYVEFFLMQTFSCL
jgi:hypothetical protein